MPELYLVALGTKSFTNKWRRRVDSIHRSPPCIITYGAILLKKNEGEKPSHIACKQKRCASKSRLLRSLGLGWRIPSKTSASRGRGAECCKDYIHPSISSSFWTRWTVFNFFYYYTPPGSSGDQNPLHTYIYGVLRDLGRGFNPPSLYTVLCAFSEKKKGRNVIELVRRHNTALLRSLWPGYYDDDK